MTPEERYNTALKRAREECIMYYFRSYNNNWGGPGQGIVPPPDKI